MKEFNFATTCRKECFIVPVDWRNSDVFVKEQLHPISIPIPSGFVALTVSERKELEKLNWKKFIHPIFAKATMKGEEK